MTKYKQEFAEQAEKLCKLGFIDTQLAEFFEVCEKTINKWKKRHPAFKQALVNGKTIADADVAASLYQRAIGASCEETHVSNFQGEITLTKIKKNYPPETKAAMFLLKNRQPKLWRDTQQVESNVNINNIMQVPVCDDIDEWEQAAQTQQDQVLKS